MYSMYTPVYMGFWFCGVSTPFLPTLLQTLLKADGIFQRTNWMGNHFLEGGSLSAASFMMNLAKETDVLWGSLRVKAEVKHVALLTQQHCTGQKNIVSASTFFFLLLKQYFIRFNSPRGVKNHNLLCCWNVSSLWAFTFLCYLVGCHFIKLTVSTWIQLPQKINFITFNLTIIFFRLIVGLKKIRQ